VGIDKSRRDDFSLGVYDSVGAPADVSGNLHYLIALDEDIRFDNFKVLAVNYVAVLD